MRIGIPVMCQNGHEATWIIVINGLEVVNKGVTHDKCQCSKSRFGEGYKEYGEPFVINEDD